MERKNDLKKEEDSKIIGRLPIDDIGGLEIDGRKQKSVFFSEKIL